jgi:hypothetical protein
LLANRWAEVELQSLLNTGVRWTTKGVLSEIVERVLLNLVEVGRIIMLDKFVTATLVLENGDSSQILLDIPKMRILQT